MRTYWGRRVPLDEANTTCAVVGCFQPLLAPTGIEEQDAVICARCGWAALLSNRYVPVWMGPEWAEVAERENLYPEPVAVPEPVALSLRWCGFPN